MNNSSQPQRKSIRLKEYDYSFPGWYYVTLCTYNRTNLFGKVVNGKMMLNDSGKIVEEEWLKTKQIRSNVDLDDYVIMPNHFHGIIISEQSNEYVEATRWTVTTCRGELNSPTTDNSGRMQYAPTKRLKNYLTGQIENSMNIIMLKRYIFIVNFSKLFSSLFSANC